MDMKEDHAEESTQERERRVPKWLSAVSNRFLPPLFFLCIAVFAFYYMPKLDSTTLKINLGIVTIAASSLSFYLAMLTL